MYHRYQKEPQQQQLLHSYAEEQEAILIATATIVVPLYFRAKNASTFFQNYARRHVGRHPQLSQIHGSLSYSLGIFKRCCLRNTFLQGPLSLSVIPRERGAFRGLIHNSFWGNFPPRRLTFFFLLPTYVCGGLSAARIIRPSALLLSCDVPRVRSG